MVLVHSSFCVRINDPNVPYFISAKGLKQGDPLSPILFKLVANVLTKMLEKASFHGLIRGLLPHVIPGGVISLQYDDDTIIFLENIWLMLGISNVSDALKPFLV